VDLPRERPGLGTKELLVKGNHHGGVHAKDSFVSAICPHRQLGAIQTTHGLPRNGQQIGMLGRNQRTYKMQRALVHQLQVIFGVVPLVEDQRDVVNLLRERTAACEPLLGHTLEGEAIVLIAGIGVMKQRNLAIGSDHHGQSQKAKMVVPLFPMAALRQLGPQVETVEEGKQSWWHQTPGRSRSKRETAVLARSCSMAAICSALTRSMLSQKR
jgi:hypothetical protein